MCVNDNSKKKLGVWIILIVFAAYVASIIALIVFTGMPVAGIIVYSAVMFIALALLCYEGWERLKEIDEGLEDAVDNY